MRRTNNYSAAALALLASVLFAASASAVEVNYRESESGDLGNNDDGETITEFTLDEGTHTIIGRAFAENGDSAPSDFDDFILTIQPGLVLTGATFSWDLGSGENAQTQFRLLDGPENMGLFTVPLGTQGTPSASGTVSMFNLPLVAGTYLVDQVSIGVFGDAAAVFDWTWTFTVEVVPLPPAAWLFISGLLAMVGISRRRRATLAT